MEAGVKKKDTTYVVSFFLVCFEGFEHDLLIRDQTLYQLSYSRMSLRGLYLSCSLTA